MSLSHMCKMIDSNLDEKINVVRKLKENNDDLD